MKRWDGVADGTRTHDNQNHNLGLYQLSYSHRSSEKEIIERKSRSASTFGAIYFDAAGAASSATLALPVISTL